MKMEKAGRSTLNVTDSGASFTTHQRKDLRWIFRINGQDSETSYPTAGEAERAGYAALKAARPRDDRWKLLFIIAVASAPIWYLLRFVIGMLTGH